MGILCYWYQRYLSGNGCHKKHHCSEDKCTGIKKCPDYKPYDEG